MGRKNYAYVNPQMLVWARSETPFTTTEAVEMLFPAITAKNLDAWESGDDYPSITEAKKLASIYKLPFATFYLSEAPAKKIKRYTDDQVWQKHSCKSSLKVISPTAVCVIML